MFMRYQSGYIALLAIYLIAFLYAFVVGGLSFLDLSDVPIGIPLVLLIFPIFAFVALAAAQMLRRNVRRPLATLTRLLYREKHWIARGIFLTILGMFFSNAFTSIKTSIPRNQKFYADEFFISADQWIFGTDPWRLTHGVFGQIETIVLDRAYLLWLTAQLILAISLHFSRDQILQLKGLITYLASWIVLGGLLATSLASVGPCYFAEFYGRHHFAPLMDALASHDNLNAVFLQRKLLDAQGSGLFGSGISAMPSMHVAIALLIVFLAKERWGLGLMFALSVVFFILIMIGSVHLGWHYAVDGLVSIAGVWIIWRLTSAFVDRVVAKEAARDRSVPFPSEPSPA